MTEIIGEDGRIRSLRQERTIGSICELRMLIVGSLVTLALQVT
jgi:hypothetical protein